VRIAVFFNKDIISPRTFIIHADVNSARNKKGLAEAKPLKNMVGRERFERSTN